MNNHVPWFLLLSFALLATACPTRVVTDDTGGGGSGGSSPPSGGAAGLGIGGAAGSHPGGQGAAPPPGGGGSSAGTAGSTTREGGRAGEGGVAGPGAMGGTSTAGAGGQAAGGANSQPGGSGGSGGSQGGGGLAGQSGLGGAAGAGSSIGGSGGSSSPSSGSVVCGQVTNCPLNGGGRCCYSAMDQSSACQGPGATCDAVPASTPGTYYVKTTIACDSSNDCAAGEICCYTQLYISSSTACMAAASCVDVTGPTGGYNTYRRQVCDPARVAPTECLSGSCKTATTYSQNLPSYLYLCL